MSNYIHHDDTDDIERLLLGRKVVSVNGDTLVLDDGTEVEVIPNEGGCSCSSGDYEIESLSTTDNIITKVEFDYDPVGDYDGGEGGYKIFVYAENVKVNLLDVQGDDGNGYYGTGFSLLVKHPKG